MIPRSSAAWNKLGYHDSQFGNISSTCRLRFIGHYVFKSRVTRFASSDVDYKPYPASASIEVTHTFYKTEATTDHFSSFSA